jgi:hypothetical protein
MSATASASRRRRSLIGGHSPVAMGDSFSDSPVPTPSTTRSGYMHASVAKAWATTAG